MRTVNGAANDGPTRLSASRHSPCSLLASASAAAAVGLCPSARCADKRLNKYAKLEKIGEGETHHAQNKSE